jgi:hypothetical protein
MPNIPSVKIYLNLVYNTAGGPLLSDPYLYQNRLNDYRRVRCWFSKVLLDNTVGKPKQIG